MFFSLDRVKRYIIVYYSSTSIYRSNFVQIRKLFVDGRTDGHGDWLY